MVIRRVEMKRKRKEDCTSSLSDDSPKRTKVHAQRKFAQGSNVNSPVITPVKEIEKHEVDEIPEPVELLPIKRPNTEDFLTFLCFRGTPILPSNLNFFNTASIVDTNGQVHEIKSESPKNGPIDTLAITKMSGSSEKPFIAFGVRKRADPIVISKQMDRKRRHALALQALRRKYQEQRMAKIRAVTISKLSEKVTNKTIVKTSTPINNEKNTKNDKSALQKIKVLTSTKSVKVPTRNVKNSLRPQIKPKMCLRSFSGRFVQKELQFKNIKKRHLSEKKNLFKKNIQKSTTNNLNKENNNDIHDDEDDSDEDITDDDDDDEDEDADDDDCIDADSDSIEDDEEEEIEEEEDDDDDDDDEEDDIEDEDENESSIDNNDEDDDDDDDDDEDDEDDDDEDEDKEDKKIVKEKEKKEEIKKKLSKMIKTSPKVILTKIAKKSAPGPKKSIELNFRVTRSNKFINNKAVSRRQQIKQHMILSTPNNSIIKTRNLRSHGKINDKHFTKSINKEINKKNTKKELGKTISPKKTVILSKELKVQIQKLSTIKKDSKTILNKKDEIKGKICDKFKNKQTYKKCTVIMKTRIAKKDTIMNKDKTIINSKQKNLLLLKLDLNKKDELSNKQEFVKIDNNDKKDINLSGKETKYDTIIKKDEIKKSLKITQETNELRTSQRPSRKTKEAAAIYMEILSHKLVNDNKIDDDNISIDSFPELPNVKRTEQRENELKAKAKSIIGIKEKKNNNIKNKKLNYTDENDNNNDDGDKKSNNKKNKRNSEINKKSNEEKSKTKILDKKQLDKNDKKNPENNKKINESDNKKNNKKETKKLNEKKKQRKYSTSSDDEKSIVSLKIKKSPENFDKDNKKTINKKSDEFENRRQTRFSSQNLKQSDSDSDESYHADIKIPKKKKITRSKGKYNKDDSPSEIKNCRNYKEFTSSNDSDHSTSATDFKLINLQTKNKRFTKLRCKKSDQSFSDSDEEPLSKLTNSNKNDYETKLKKNQLIENTKPKRECAKRPQNYLPMFSSSDEEDQFFLGCTAKSDNNTKCTNILNEQLDNLQLDLSFKDIDKRFGKGKVNMSNEQIEKWLKESAMAGNNLKKENDEMLKFDETETSLDIPDLIDTQKLKSTLLINTDIKNNEEKKSKTIDVNLIETEDSRNSSKSTSVERKLIFKKDKKSPSAPNVNAFSANNESSIYAFGEESEVVMKTPFRRPSRRPSSTATSTKSEDESSRYDDSVSKTGQFRKPSSINLSKTEEKENTETEDSDHCFGIPLPLNVKNNKKIDDKTTMIPPKNKVTEARKRKTTDPVSESGDEFKYKIPSSPSASSSSSAKLYKRQTVKPKIKSVDLTPVTVTDFPTNGPAQLVEAPTFYPTEKEFQDPFEYIEKIRQKAEQFGICRIVPPSTFKPECKVTDDMRFTAYNQYVHKMLHRWGPNFKELMAIKKYLSTQNITFAHPPWIGGMEVDLPRLYQTVQSLGGLKEVIEKKKWPKVSDLMKIPKSAQDRVTKLDDIYCKYLLPYDTLSPDERSKLFDDVETEWAKRESKSLLKAQQILDDDIDEDLSDTDDEAEECIVKGRSVALNAFYRIARNTMCMWFKTTTPNADEVEQEFWKHVTLKQFHICVHSGSIDSGNYGYGFAVSKNSPFARHAWNLKVLTNNSGSVLRSLGPVMGVTVPTLHVGMVFSACCWYRDPHSLPWIEYLHTGGSKIWYGIPDTSSNVFHYAMNKLVPNYCQNKSLWLPSDTVMVPPNILVDNDVSLSRVVQEPGQFVVVFSKAFTSSLSTGYVVSESVYFAPPSWLKTTKDVFNELRENCEPSMFSLERLLFSIINDNRTNIDVLKQIINNVQDICDNEKLERQKIKSFGTLNMEKLPLPDAHNKKKKKQQDDGDYECEICRMNLFISVISENVEDGIYCLKHAIEEIENKKILIKNCKLMYTYDDSELDLLIVKLKTAIEHKSQKKMAQSKYSGMPTLLK